MSTSPVQILQPIQPTVAPPQTISPQTVGSLLESEDFNKQPTQFQRDILSKHYNPKLADLSDDEFNQYKSLLANKLGKKIPTFGPTKADRAIEFARPFVSDAVGLGAGALAGPETLGAASIPVGIAAKTGVDALLQHMESQPPQGMLSSTMGLRPGGVADTLTNSAQMLLTNKLLNAIGSKIIKGGKAAANAWREQPTNLPTNLETANYEPSTTDLSGKVSDAFRKANQSFYSTSAVPTESQALNSARNIENASKNASNAAYNESPKLASLSEFGNQLKDQFLKGSVFNKFTGAGSAYEAMHLPMAIMQHSVTPMEAIGGTVAGIKLSKAAYNTLLSNPRTARIIKAIADKEPLGVSNEFASKAITDVLNGTGMSLTGDSSKD